ncbi:hypothetical protein [Planktothricoides raciborskii]|uniref:Uncharacterized protein n=1 Tax=Planktothricoides raciborskii FACHB-1370 TaxID=2949576 RepID=A0ABR8EM90_9CYAN|nr:hypothetical protein [Planktothricoides raciborskii]MBD2546677.1 hypothetical protein [Planktothricoides raciborskii FACHB-1370]MBD2585143.1 hypothetical protein [Planktothricoides raciborskii FACHB-1261]
MAIRPYIFTKETRFLGGLRGLRNRVSVVKPKDNCDMPIRNPVSGWSAGIKKPGFWVGCQR